MQRRSGWTASRWVGGSLLPLLLTATGCEQRAAPRVHVAADTAAREVPFRLVGPNGVALVVAVHINGEGPFDFVFDTGATYTCLDQALTRRLGLETRPGAGTGIGVSGVRRVPVVEVDSIRIGTNGIDGLRACVLNLSHMRQLGIPIHGIVGLNFMKSFRITLDFERERLRFEP